jgi:hypothetical protein
VKLRSKILFVLIFLFLLGIIILMPHGGYRRDLENYKKELLARGEKLTIAELAPPHSTNPANGAKAFMLFMSNYSPPVDYFPMKKMVSPGLAEIGCTSNAPIMTNHYAENMQEMAKLRTILNAPVLDFDMEYSKEYGVPLSHMGPLHLAELLAAHTAMQALHAKDYSEARSDLLSAADLIRLAPNEPIMGSDLERMSMAGIAINGTWEALQSGEWTDPQLAELQAKWQNLDFFRRAETALIFEKPEEIAFMTKARRASSGFVYNASHPLGGLGPPGGRGGLAGLGDKITELYNRYPRIWSWKSSWSYDEELCYLQMADAALASCRLAKATGAFAPALKKLRQDDASIFLSHRNGDDHFIFSGFGGACPTYLLKTALAESARRLTVTAIALKRYHLQNGVYPVTLDDLVPAFLPAVPADFMDGKPLRYKLRPDGDFLLYSVGEDGQDNGGDPTPVPPATSINNWLAGRDIVWPRVATPAALEEYRQHSQSATNTPGK